MLNFIFKQAYKYDFSIHEFQINETNKYDGSNT